MIHAILADVLCNFDVILFNLIEISTTRIADVLCNFDVILFNLIQISAARFGRMLIIYKFVIIHIKNDGEFINFVVTYFGTHRNDLLSKVWPEPIVTQSNKNLDKKK